MELRTVVKVDPSPFRITYNDPLMFIGSCFAGSIGKKMELGRMPVMINPSGTVYNPLSVINTLEFVLSGRMISKEEIFSHNGTWVSFNHHTDFTSDDPDELVEKVNNKTSEAHSFIQKSKFLFITFGTARVYREKQSGKVVSNCHKIPSSHFENELLKVNDITGPWNHWLGLMNMQFPSLRIIFTISPIRHWKDGAHGNQLSKSTLFLAVEELLKHPSGPGYFPAYEIMMDDLRDYRFYDDDMLHPSPTAINYIWDVFSGCYFDTRVNNTWNAVSKIVKACNHKFIGSSGTGRKLFAEGMLNQIVAIEKQIPSIDFSSERLYFRNLLM
jgi:hypothetical protein